MRVITIVCLISCLFLSACSDDPVMTLENKMAAVIAWKVQAQSSLDVLRMDVSNLQSQRLTYNKAEVDAMIKKLKDDQSWIKTEVPSVISSSAVPSSAIPSSVIPSSALIPATGVMIWDYGTYQIDGSIKDIYFRGRHQTWKIIVANTSQSYVRVVPLISFKMYADPQKNIYTSSGASLTWDNEQDGVAFGPTGVLCGSKAVPFNMPSGIRVDSSGLDNLSLSVYPNVVNIDANGDAYTNFTNSLTIAPNCGGTNGLGSVLVGPGQTVVWTLSVTIDTHQGSVIVSKIAKETNYSEGPWSMGVSFLIDKYQ